jgi:hypothetical protein
LNLQSKLQPPRSNTGSIHDNDTRALSKDPLRVRGSQSEGFQGKDEHRGLRQLKPVKHKFKFTTGNIADSNSPGKFKASLGSDACAVDFTPAGQGLSTEIEMSCPEGTLPSPLKVQALTTDGWFLETVEYYYDLGSNWEFFGPSKVWLDKPPYGVIAGNYQCTTASPCDVQEFTHKVPRTPTPTPNPTLMPVSTADPTLMPVSTADTCEEETELLMEKIHEKYSDEGMTETKVSTNEIFVDFSTNSRQNKVYAAACAAEGNYQELHYTATCKNTGIEENLIISGHPRCYASTCAPEDQAMLLQKFAIQLMEERANENSNTVYTCEGKKSTVEFSSLCDYQTQTLNSADELTLAQVDLEPSVDSKKFLWIFDRTEQLVTFAEGAEASDYQTACTARDGNLSVKTIQALCTDKATEEVDVPYSIEGYTVCLASGCNADTADTSALVSFVSMMKIRTKFSSTMACEVSGAGLLTMGVVMALTFCSVLLQAC